MAIGIQFESNQMNSVVEPVRNDSTPDQFIYTDLYGVSHVLVPHTVLTFVAMLLVFVAISDDRASRATLIDPDIDPRVNI